MAAIPAGDKPIAESTFGSGEWVRVLPAQTLPRLERGLKREWKTYRKALKKCQEKFSERAVHDSRVGTRRLISILGLFAPFVGQGRAKKAQAALKHYLDTFDGLRDTQVQLLTVRGLNKSHKAVGPFWQYLKRREARLSRRTRKAIRSVKTRRLGGLIECCRGAVRDWWATGSHTRANRLLLKCVDDSFQQTRILRDRIRPDSTESIHRTRVAFKKFRYMVETLAGDLPFVTPGSLRAMQRYQTSMGDIQDAEILLRGFDKFASKGKIDPDLAQRFREQLWRRRARLIQKYLRKSDELVEFWPLTPAREQRNLRDSSAAAAEPRPVSQHGRGAARLGVPGDLP